MRKAVKSSCARLSHYKISKHSIKLSLPPGKKVTHNHKTLEGRPNYCVLIYGVAAAIAAVQAGDVAQPEVKHLVARNQFPIPDNIL